MNTRELSVIVATNKYIKKHGTNGRSHKEIHDYVNAFFYEPSTDKQLESRAERFSKAGYLDCNDHIDYFKNGNDYEVVFVD